MERLENITPGEILSEEFLKPLEISQTRLSKELGVSQSLIASIISGRSKITANMAIRLGKFFGNSAKFWLGLQNDYDIEKEQQKYEYEISRITALTH